MGRYIGPKNNILKSLGDLPGLKILNVSNKISKKNLQTKTKKTSDFGLRLKEKQKIRYNYGLSELQMYNYVKKNQSLLLKAPSTVLELIELRLDTIVYNFNFTSTIAGARQLINHGKICINTKRVTIASFNCAKNDIISVCKNIKMPYRESVLPEHLIKLNLFTGIIKETTIKTFQLKINERLVIEYYSKR